MNPIEELKAEHEGIKASLEILDRIAARLADGAGPEVVEDARDLIEFYKVFVDTCHHGKEEELLFPELERIGVSRQGGPIGVMLAEHDTGRAHVRGMRKALLEHPEANPAAAVEFGRQAEGFIRLLLAHIQKENEVLFRIADQHLPPAKKEEIAEGFERIERERVGAGRHEAFHAKLDELHEKYVSGKFAVEHRAAVSY